MEASAYGYFADLAGELPDLPADSILSRTLYEGEDAKVILFGFAPGQALSEHTAARPAILHFLSGEARLVLGADTLEAGPGTWVRMPPRLTHAIHARTQVVMLLVLLGPGD